ncbi:MAG: maltokinase N-terminal cap-like domain-containing protein, partial [Egibacteraceae bacterium]
MTDLAAALRAWVPRQRWFAGKARTVAALRVADTVRLRRGDTEILDVLVDVDFDDGHVERYQVPLAAGDNEMAAGEKRAEGGGGVVVNLDGEALVDATTAPQAAGALAQLSCGPEPFTTAGGATVQGDSVADDVRLDVTAPRRLGAEQSNTSVVFGDRHILKVFRKLEPGENPEVEVTRALTRQGFDAAPAQHGALALHDGDDVTALTVLADFVAGGREGWDVATAEVRRLADSTVDCALPDPWLLDRFADLGRTVADLHAALRDTLGSRDATPADLGAWAVQMQQQVERVLR